MTKRIEDDIIIEDVLKIINQTKNYSLKNYKVFGKFGASTISSHFGSWNDLMKKLNLDAPKKSNISKEEIIEDVKNVFNKTNNTTRENYLKNGKFSKSPIKRIFGSWNNLLKELNYKYNINKNYSKEEILVQYKQLCSKHNKQLTAIEFRKLSDFSQSIVDNVFGSFTNMKKELKLDIDSRFYSDEEILTNLTYLYNTYGFVSLDLIRQYGIVSPPTVIHRFGSIYKACELSNIPYKIDCNMSYLSKFVLDIAKEVFGEQYALEQTFTWLKNPDTNRNLFIDIYYPDIKLAIEVDGKQHYEFCKKFHKSIEDFNYAKYRDNIKDKLLQEHNIKVIRIKQGFSRNNILNIFNSFYKSNG